MSRGTRLYLIRHAETEWNNSGRYQGHIDIALSLQGRRQAALLRDRLREEKLVAVYTSDLKRARETAVIIAEPHGLPVVEVPDLRELNFGLWEGLTYQEIAACYTKDLEEWLAHPAVKQIPGGESFAQVQKRTSGVITKIIAEHPGEKVAIVSHGGTLLTMVLSCLGLDLDRIWHFRLDNASLSILDCFDGRYILTLFNEVHHLQEDKREDK
ncbi:MAG: alpha-ribazole phosphatase [Moorellaceae bacterium]